MQLSNDLSEFIHLLNKHNAEYLVVGAWAVAFHSKPRFTGDLDLFIRNSPANVEQVLFALDEFGFGDLGITKDDLLGDNRIVQIGIAPNRLDLITGLSGVSFEEAWEDRVQGKIDGVSVNYIGVRQLIANKRATGRPRDIADIAQLERTQG